MIYVTVVAYVVDYASSWACEFCVRDKRLWEADTVTIDKMYSIIAVFQLPYLTVNR